MGNRRAWVSVAAVVFTMWSLSSLYTRGHAPTYRSWRKPTNNDLQPISYDKNGDFFRYPLPGYDNNEISGRSKNAFRAACPTLQVFSEIGYQKPWMLDDDLSQIAFSLADHPMVEYTSKLFPKEQSLMRMSDLVKKSWDRMANACVFLSEYQVNLCVTRVLFKGNNNYGRCIVSFLRGQIFDKNWNHMNNHVIHWRDKSVTFPTMFETPSEYFEDGGTFGPEDPRIIIEENVPGAEPVIIYNMKTAETDWKRAMWFIRPFSGHSSVLSIDDQERRKTEKNWVPTFVETSEMANKKPSERTPSDEIHLVYNFNPIQILKCNLLSGDCTFTYKDEVEEGLVGKYENAFSFLRGGTQFVPVPLRPAPTYARAVSEKGSTLLGGSLAPNYQMFLSFPRTHTEKTEACPWAVYRPEIMVLLTNGSSWVVAHASFPIDLGAGTLLSEKDFMQPCAAGRILLFNSIASWDTAADLGKARFVGGDSDSAPSRLNTKDGRASDLTDVMTITATVNDASAQAVRLTGILDYLKKLPSVQEFLNHPERVFDTSMVKTEESDSGKSSVFERNIVAGMAVRSCVEAEARTYVGEHAIQST
ncbi:hypothetical protein C1H76_4711 [Elsinoe australis]|uniref:Uncharacterized protein n=1 Tax=Elsinoe australis TaxID=40998 RepID=A0A4U7AXM8_9PEZI|nr:hypothetical protein C1H76_4711 [Elsinoe australis]